MMTLDENGRSKTAVDSPFETMKKIIDLQMEKVDEKILDLAQRQFCHELSQIPMFPKCIALMCAEKPDDYTKMSFDACIERALINTKAAINYVYGSGRAVVDAKEEGVKDGTN